jgi:hypothetical protein
MIDTADTLHPSHRLVVAVGLVACAFFGALSVFHGQAPESGAALTGAPDVGVRHLWPTPKPCCAGEQIMLELTTIETLFTPWQSLARAAC